jgi:hypothetical protein
LSKWLLYTAFADGQRDCRAEGKYFAVK